MPFGITRAGGVIAALCASLVPLVACAQQARPNPPVLCVENYGCGNALPSGSSSSDSGIKWHPGHYMQVGRSRTESIQPDIAAGTRVRFGYYDQIASNPNIEGVKVFMRWKMLEPEEGDYSAGIALVRSEIDYLKNLASPKRFVLQVFGIAYGSGDPYAAAENYYPTYFIDAGCTLAKNGSGTKVLRWNVANRTCRDYYVRMIEAYAAEFDGEPYFEGIVIPDQETSFDVDSSPAWSIASHDAGIRDLASRTKALFVESNVIVSLNYLARGTSHVEVASMMSYLTSIGVGTNPPDTCPYDVAGCESFWIDQVRIGVIGGEDYRGTAPIWQSVESSEMGWDTVGPPGGFTAQQVYDYAIYEQQASHMFWDRNEEAGNSQQRWGTGILPVINANPLTNTPCPALYEACNRN